MLRMKLLGVHSLMLKGQSDPSRASPSRNANSDGGESSKVLRDSSAQNHAANVEASRTDFSVKDNPGFNRIGTPSELKVDTAYDSASSFEFHQAERMPSMARPFSRQVSSKWNDAEKWLTNRQVMHQNENSVTCAHSGARNLLEKFSFATHQSSHNSLRQLDNSATITSAYQIKMSKKDSSASRTTVGDPKVSVRNVGTEMTPIPSEEASRTSTPIRSMTQTHSPEPALSSTPIGEPTASAIDVVLESKRKDNRDELSERELKLKTRREIAELGLQLGKMSIASWASKEDKELAKVNDLDHLKREHEARAVSWREAENSKHIARFKREEVKIQAWVNHQRAKFEAEMREVEAQAECMRTQALEKTAEKLKIIRQLAEEKRAAAEAKMNQQAARATQRAEHIRRTGRISPIHNPRCSGFFQSFKLERINL